MERVQGGAGNGLRRAPGAARQTRQRIMRAVLVQSLCAKGKTPHAESQEEDGKNNGKRFSLGLVVPPRGSLCETL